MQGVQSSIQSLINYNSLKYKRPFSDWHLSHFCGLFHLHCQRFTQISRTGTVVRYQMQSHDLRKQEYAVKKAATCLSSAPVSLGACFFRVGVPYSTNIENFRLTRKSGHSTTATQMVTSVSFFCLLSFSCIHVFFLRGKIPKK